MTTHFFQDMILPPDESEIPENKKPTMKICHNQLRFPVLLRWWHHARPFTLIAGCSKAAPFYGRND